MSDLETRLRETLAERAGAAPDGLGLATGARRRWRRRRTTWAVAAAAVVAAGVPLGLSQLTPSSDGSGRIADEPTATSGLPPEVIEMGYRAESWHDVTFEVPADWGYGGATAWCTAGDTPEEALPLVTRPDSITPAIACSPASGYGVTVGPDVLLDPAYMAGSGEVFQYVDDDPEQQQLPEGAWVAYATVREVAVTVVTDDESLTRRIVDSVERFIGRDPNGCPTTLGEAEAALTTDTYQSFSICHYGRDDLLTASRRLIGTESQVAEDAIFSSPRKTRMVDCPTEDDLSRTALLSSGGYVATAVTGAVCEGWNGLFASGVERDLTPEALRHLDLGQLPVPPEE